MKQSNLDEAFRKLIRESGLPLTKFAEATETTKNQTLLWWSQPHKFFLSDKQISLFESFYGIPIDELAYSSEKIQLLRKRFNDNPTSLPEKYELGASSYVRSSFYILKYLSFLNGQEFVDKLVTKLDVHPLYLENVDNKINIQFITDLLNQCKILGFDKEHFKNLASSMFLSIENTSIENLFSTVNSYEEFYHSLEKMACHFDSNFDYDFKIGRTGAEFITKPSEQLKELLSTSDTDISFLYQYRPLLFAQAPLICEMKPLPIEVRSCVSRGDLSSCYRVHFPDVTLRII